MSKKNFLWLASSLMPISIALPLISCGNKEIDVEKDIEIQKDAKISETYAKDADIKKLVNFKSKSNKVKYEIVSSKIISNEQGIIEISVQAIQNNKVIKTFTLKIDGFKKQLLNLDLITDLKLKDSENKDFEEYADLHEHDLIEQIEANANGKPLATYLQETKSKIAKAKLYEKDNVVYLTLTFELDDGSKLSKDFVINTLLINPFKKIFNELGVFNLLDKSDSTILEDYIEDNKNSLSTKIFTKKYNNASLFSYIDSQNAKVEKLELLPYSQKDGQVKLYVTLADKNDATKKYEKTFIIDGFKKMYDANSFGKLLEQINLENINNKTVSEYQNEFGPNEEDKLKKIIYNDNKKLEDFIKKYNLDFQYADLEATDEEKSSGKARLTFSFWTKDYTSFEKTYEISGFKPEETLWSLVNDLGNLDLKDKTDKTTFDYNKAYTDLKVKLTSTSHSDVTNYLTSKGIQISDISLEAVSKNQGILKIKFKKDSSELEKIYEISNFKDNVVYDGFSEPLKLDNVDGTKTVEEYLSTYTNLEEHISTLAKTNAEFKQYLLDNNLKIFEAKLVANKDNFTKAVLTVTICENGKEDNKLTKSFDVSGFKEPNISQSSEYEMAKNGTLFTIDKSAATYATEIANIKNGWVTFVPNRNNNTFNYGKSRKNAKTVLNLLKYNGTTPLKDTVFNENYQGSGQKTLVAKVDGNKVTVKFNIFNKKTNHYDTFELVLAE